MPLPSEVSELDSGNWIQWDSGIQGARNLIRRTLFGPIKYRAPGTAYFWLRTLGWFGIE